MVTLRYNKSVCATDDNNRREVCIMKKFVAILMALCLLCGFAMAEEINWADVEPSVTEAGIEGSFASVSSIGVKMFIPSGLSELELSDEDVENGYICYLTDSDQTCAAVVMYADLNGASLDKYAEVLPEVGATEIELCTLNGIPVVTYSMPENNTMNVCLLTDTGYGIEFVFFPADDENFKSVATIMAASIQPE